MNRFLRLSAVMLALVSVSALSLAAITWPTHLAFADDPEPNPTDPCAEE